MDNETNQEGPYYYEPINCKVPAFKDLWSEYEKKLSDDQIPIQLDSIKEKLEMIEVRITCLEKYFYVKCSEGKSVKKIDDQMKD